MNIVDPIKFSSKMKVYTSAIAYFAYTQPLCVIRERPKSSIKEKLNEDRKIYKGHIGLHDMKLCVEAAKDVSLEIEY